MSNINRGIYLPSMDFFIASYSSQLCCAIFSDILSVRSGTDVMIIKIFFAEKFAFLLQLQLFFLQKMIITLVFEKNAIFAENWQKSQKIVIITSTPGINIFEVCRYIPSIRIKMLWPKTEFEKGR
jgi:hypothetical protein